jgi:hypothetical protein
VRAHGLHAHELKSRRTHARTHVVMYCEQVHVAFPQALRLTDEEKAQLRKYLEPEKVDASLMNPRHSGHSGPSRLRSFLFSLPSILASSSLFFRVEAAYFEEMRPDACSCTCVCVQRTRRGPGQFPHQSKSLGWMPTNRMPSRCCANKCNLSCERHAGKLRNS